MPALFLTLPQEVQNEVYRLLFANTTIYIRCETLRKCCGYFAGEKHVRQPDPNLLAITRTCKRVRADAMSCFFSTALFDTWSFHLFRNCPRRDNDVPKDERLEQHYLESLSRLQRIKLNPWQLFRSDVKQSPARILGHWSSFHIHGLREVRTATNIIWISPRQAFNPAARPDKLQEINTIARIMVEAPALSIFMEITMGMLENIGWFDSSLSQACLKIVRGHVDIVLPPRDDQAKRVLQQYVSAIQTTFASMRPENHALN